MQKTEWIICPVCRQKTRNKIREDTVMINFPLFCPKCKQESLIEVKKYAGKGYQRITRKLNIVYLWWQ